MVQRVKLLPWTLVVPVLVLAAGAEIEIWSRPLAGSKPVLAALALAYSLILLTARHRPLGAVAVTFGAIALMALAEPVATNDAAAPLFAGLAAGFLVARYGTREQALIGLVAGLSAVVLVARDQPGLSSAIATFVITAVLVAVTWGTGFTLRQRDRHAEAAEERAKRAEAGREVAARVAVAEERARIARELHDIVAHAVSVMVLQSGAVRHRLPAERIDDKATLSGIERVGREALTEMRLLLGAMRSEGEGAERAPQPGLEDLPRLVEDVNRAGLRAALDIEGQPCALPRGIELSAYRIVQEGLTNALKHAGAHRVDVRLRYADDALSIEVHDDGSGGGAAGELGHGLIGVGERVKVYGGEMSAGRAPEGGFVLRSRLPIAAGA